MYLCPLGISVVNWEMFPIFFEKDRTCGSVVNQRSKLFQITGHCNAGSSDSMSEYPEGIGLVSA